MINTFWSWLTQSLSSALQTLNNIVTNETMQPFYALFLVVFTAGLTYKLLIKPLFGGAGSDKVKKGKGENE